MTGAGTALACDHHGQLVSIGGSPRTGPLYSRLRRWRKDDVALGPFQARPTAQHRRSGAAVIRRRGTAMDVALIGGAQGDRLQTRCPFSKGRSVSSHSVSKEDRSTVRHDQSDLCRL